MILEPATVVLIGAPDASSIRLKEAWKVSSGLDRSGPRPAAKLLATIVLARTGSGSEKSE